ncbi:class I SAM-dependent methyltransferase [Bacillus timonensis]|uniref:Class I SAM-dependent methyltransferase n=1 Tax=Bacillus timonensis TaxID=1033734 RepID=A0A4S3PRH7_9BACI|nr:class I SAM-dependent methyltransferase [Bacillus timonensis]THE12148.1 class I SAM-dependent methyltransferase [Bacillus timonensis]
MTEHYYTSKPTVSSNRKTQDFVLRGHTFSFTSDSGVFSKSEVDFGSRLLIEEFRAPEVDGPFLDVGCGYGPIGLALAKVHNERSVEMIDVNERAIELAKKNAEANKISNVDIHQSDLFADVEKRGFAAIISNPPIRAGKKVVHHILEESYRYLVPGGELWVVIQKKQGAPSAIEKLESVFDEVEIVERKKGYHIIKAVRAS